MRISDWSSDVCSSDLERQLVAVPACDRRVRLHHGVTMIGRCVARVEFDRRACEGRIEVAEARIGLGAEGGRRLDRAVERLGQIETALRTAILNTDKSRRRPSLLETLRNQDRKSTRLNSSH